MLFFIYIFFCIYILNVVWQLNALNGFSFQLICNFSNKKIFIEKETNYLFILRPFLWSLVYLVLL